MSTSPGHGWKDFFRVLCRIRENKNKLCHHKDNDTTLSLSVKNLSGLFPGAKTPSFAGEFSLPR
jgi:hypothetical protein